MKQSKIIVTSDIRNFFEQDNKRRELLQTSDSW